MKFHLKTCVLLTKEFDIETEHLKDAEEMVKRLIAEEVNLNGYELDRIAFYMDDPSIREYNQKMCQEIVAGQCDTQQS